MIYLYSCGFATDDREWFDGHLSTHPGHRRDRIPAARPHATMSADDREQFPTIRADYAAHPVPRDPRPCQFRPVAGSQRRKSRWLVSRKYHASFHSPIESP
jgi:hypothetical protein